MRCPFHGPSCPSLARHGSCSHHLQEHRHSGSLRDGAVSVCVRRGRRNQNVPAAIAQGVTKLLVSTGRSVPIARPVGKIHHENGGDSMLRRVFICMFLFGGTACSSSTTTEPSATDGGVYVNGYAFQSCASSASPLPGWRSCQGTVRLIINRALSSGYVSVFFNYPTSSRNLEVTPLHFTE